MKKLIRILMLPAARLAMIYMAEIFLTANMILYLNDRIMAIAPWFETLSSILEAITVACFLFVVFNPKIEHAYRIDWMLMLILSPVFGGLVFLVFAKDKPLPESFKRMSRLGAKYRSFSSLAESEKSRILRKELSYERSMRVNLASFLANSLSVSMCNDAEPHFYASKEKGWSDILKAIESAEKSVWMEFFIISDGLLLERVISILERKAKKGADIRILYDGFGCLGKLKQKTLRRMRNAGIQVREFNRIRLHLNQDLNYRNHRKAVIADEKIAFIGGVNLADEYAENGKGRLGFWFDSVMSVKSGVAKDLAAFFLQDWLFAEKRWHARMMSEKLSGDKWQQKKQDSLPSKDGFCQAYASSPFDSKSVSKSVFTTLVSRSERTFYFTTPYLALDKDTMETLALCSQSGVDVKVIIPGVPDKKIAYAITKSHMNMMMENGIEVYVYKKGFIHSKLAISDGEYAIVGSANTDYRSFFLNFENGVALYRCEEVKKMSKTFESLLTDCKKASLQKEKLPKKAVNMMLRLLSVMF